MNGVQRTPPRKISVNNNTSSGNKSSINTQLPLSKRPCSSLSPEQNLATSDSNVNIGNVQLVDLKTLETSLASLLDDRLKNMPTKSDLLEVKKKMESLERSNEVLQSKLQQVESKCLVLERQIEFLEKKSKENNLVLHITSHGDDQHTMEKAKSVCLDLLQDNNPASITRTKLIRSRDNRIANVIVEMQNSDFVPRILKSASKLRDTGISIHRDYTKAAREKRKQLLQIKAKTNAKNRNIRVLIRGQTLIIEHKTFYLDENNTLKCDDADGLIMFKNIMSDCDDSTQMTTTANLQNNNVGNAVQYPGFSGVGSSRNYNI